jgi:hypothetical protein
MRKRGAEAVPAACLAWFVRQQKLMIAFALILLGLAAAAAACTCYAACRAPLGYEDQRGFHLRERRPQKPPTDSLETAPEPGLLRGVR